MSVQKGLNIQENLAKVQEKIAETCYKSNRDPEKVQLVVVTKEKSAVVVKEVVEAGVRVIGESYLQEANFKMGLLSDLDIHWHMIGHIQSGKSRQVAAQFSFIHSLDRQGLAEDLNAAGKELDRVLPVLLECNVSGEQSKYGWSADEEKTWDELLDRLDPVMEMANIDVRGLMTMAPYHPDPEHSRPYFRKLKRLQGEMKKKYPSQDLDELSMGMSADFQVAIEEGATILRIGSAIVGPRE